MLNQNQLFRLARGHFSPTLRHNITAKKDDDDDDGVRTYSILKNAEKCSLYLNVPRSKLTLSS